MRDAGLASCDGGAQSIQFCLSLRMQAALSHLCQSRLPIRSVALCESRRPQRRSLLFLMVMVDPKYLTLPPKSFRRLGLKACFDLEPKSPQEVLQVCANKLQDGEDSVLSSLGASLEPLKGAVAGDLWARGYTEGAKLCMRPCTPGSSSSLKTNGAKDSKLVTHKTLALGLGRHGREAMHSETDKRCIAKQCPKVPLVQRCRGQWALEGLKE